MLEGHISWPFRSDGTATVSALPPPSRSYGTSIASALLPIKHIHFGPLISASIPIPVISTFHPLFNFLSRNVATHFGLAATYFVTCHEGLALHRVKVMLRVTTRICCEQNVLCARSSASYFLAALRHLQMFSFIDYDVISGGFMFHHSESIVDWLLCRLQYRVACDELEQRTIEVGGNRSMKPQGVKTEEHSTKPHGVTLAWNRKGWPWNRRGWRLKNTAWNCRGWPQHETAGGDRSMNRRGWPKHETMSTRWKCISSIAVGDRMFLGMQDFDFAQI